MRALTLALALPACANVHTPDLTETTDVTLADPLAGSWCFEAGPRSSRLELYPSGEAVISDATSTHHGERDGDVIYWPDLPAYVLDLRDGRLLAGLGDVVFERCAS